MRVALGPSWVHVLRWLLMAAVFTAVVLYTAIAH